MEGSKIKIEMKSAEKTPAAASAKSQAIKKSHEAAPLEKDPLLIREMFRKISTTYDRTNNALSFFLHRYWNKCLIASLKPSNTLLDLCSGTGEVAYAWLKKQPSSKTAYLLDFCEEMLDRARSKSLPHLLKGHTLHFLPADATLIPLPSSSVGAATIAYGIRNIQDLPRCFQEAYRVLNEGGELSILELTEPKNSFLKLLHRFYLSKVLPRIGGMMSKEKEAYEYLAKSIPSFTKPLEIKEKLLDAGFKQIFITSLTGGIATLIQATK